MGRKRLLKPKKDLTLKVDPDLLDELTKDGVNKSRLFSLAARRYLRKKTRKNSK